MAGTVVQTLIDISPIIDESISVWPGDIAFQQPSPSDVRMSLHTGAHADAPRHLVNDGPDIADFGLEPFIGRCVVINVDARRGERITPESLGSKKITAPRVLLRTMSFRYWRTWSDDFAAVATSLIADLKRRGVILLGIDTPSIDPFGSDLDAHHACIEHGIATLEGLVLDDVAEGEYDLIAPPLRIRGADGSPVRALLRTI